MKMDLLTPLPPVRPPESHELQALERRIWEELQASAQQRGHPWRTAVLATCDASGLPDARTVILREVQPELRELKFYSDARSPKVAQLMAQPRATMVVWSPELSWQLRLSLECSVRSSGLEVLSRWAQLRLTPAAHDYLSPLPPGSQVESPEPERGLHEHFAVLTANVLAIDWLMLNREGHRRARFETGQAPTWLQP
jgi:pyridoxamine 5'-phosphate oxidase